MHCCDELTQNLGNHNVRPTPAYISQADWNSGRRHAGWYPGADGPGYYYVHDMDEIEQIPTPDGTFTQPRIEYRRMEKCPYCEAQLT